MTRTLLLLAVISTGLIAGLFAAFSYSVMPGLRRVDDASFVATMRGINVAILNPVFGALFGGALILTLVVAVLGWRGEARWWLVVGAGLYVVAVVITMAVNVPLNTALQDGVEPVARLRAAFESSWTVWNVVRTVTSVGAFASLAVAALRL
ncbi:MULTISPECIES: anthrone oxygenase family protein [unclassified Gordonia (in: high G+C Gram-positive bacteria)]